MEDDGDDFSFDFESTLEEQQMQAASAPTGDPSSIASAAVPVNQSSSSFKRNFRQVIHCIERTDAFSIGNTCKIRPVKISMRLVSGSIVGFLTSMSSRVLQMVL